MRNSDRNYHESRAEDELRRAEQASDPAVANIHRQLAALHRRQMLALVESDGSPGFSRTPAVGPGH